MPGFLDLSLLIRALFLLVLNPWEASHTHRHHTTRAIFAQKQRRNCWAFAYLHKSHEPRCLISITFPIPGPVREVYVHGLSSCHRGTVSFTVHIVPYTVRAYVWVNVFLLVHFPVPICPQCDVYTRESVLWKKMILLRDMVRSIREPHMRRVCVWPVCERKCDWNIGPEWEKQNQQAAIKVESGSSQQPHQRQVIESFFRCEAIGLFGPPTQQMTSTLCANDEIAFVGYVCLCFTSKWA